MKPSVKPWRWSADMPPRTGVQVARAPMFAGFALSAATIAFLPRGNPLGAGITVSKSNIAAIPSASSTLGATPAQRPDRRRATHRRRFVDFRDARLALQPNSLRRMQAPVLPPRIRAPPISWTSPSPDLDLEFIATRAPEPCADQHALRSEFSGTMKAYRRYFADKTKVSAEPARRRRNSVCPTRSTGSRRSWCRRSG